MPINRIFLCCTMLTLLFASPQAEAQWIPNPFDNCGTGRRYVAPVPVVAVPNPCVCVETALMPRQQMVYQDIRETRYRQEQVTEQIPVTRYRNVSVDEGGFQMVWVPKVVTKQVPETVYQSRTVSRIVPYQTVTRVPRISTTYESQTVVRPYAIGTSLAPTLAPQAATEPLPRTGSAAPSVVAPYEPARAAGHSRDQNPVQLDSDLTRNSRTSYDSQISSQRGGKVSPSSAAVFRQYR